MALNIESDGKNEIFRLEGELNLYNVAKIRNEIYQYLDTKPEIKSVIMDMTDVSILDSSGIALMTHLQRKIKESGSKFYLVNLNTTIMTTLRLSSLDKHFQIFDTLQDIPA